MKVVGLVAEYNPFHNGHLYHIKKSKEITGADHVLVIMSGNYVQRGAPAMLPKHVRTEMALRAGASAVIELPVCFSLGSAEYFAAGAVSLLDQLGCTDAVCFGSECADTAILKKIADITLSEPEEYKAALRAALKKGASFPLARQTALEACLSTASSADISVGAVLSQPNNILGIEYIKALKLIKSSIEVFTVRRAGSGYHDEKLSGNLSSASAIRKLLSCAEMPLSSPGQESDAGSSLSGFLAPLKGQVPPFCLSLLKDTCGVRYPVLSNDFSLILKYRLLTETPASLARYMDVTEDLANRICNLTDALITFDQFCERLKTRDMTYTRISRCLFHILLNITTEDMLTYKKEGYCRYARLLGFRKDCVSLLSRIKKSTQIPLVTKLTQTAVPSAAGRRMLSQDITASNLYESILTDKFKTSFINEYKQQIVIL